MSDRIFLDNLRLKCRIGITEEERREPQEVILDISLIIKLRAAGKDDNIDNTVNYREVMQQISQFVSKREFRLLESLADGIATRALKVFGVERVIVKVRKAKYSSEPSIGIEIERERESDG
ncbi:MAG: dihydroneopterin aldolase [Nitrososphaerota archaeon]|nr:dihydroneopterin aldolase [Nitrososphaerota archaeon]MDG7024167.1 dihydroneopterin aldolase [Nitrososphaerota archaeon]